MSDNHKDPLLRDLAERHAERERELDEAENLEDADPRVRAASQPLDAAARQRIVEHLKQVVADDPRVVPMRRPRPWRFALPLAAMLVAVFSMLVYPILMKEPPASELPAYAARFQGASQLLRGDSDEQFSATGVVTKVADGNRVDIVLTPERPVDGEIVARAFLSQAGGGWLALSPAMLSVSEQGAVRFEAIVGSDLMLTAEPQDLLVMLGAAAALPSPQQAVSASRDGASKDSASNDSASNPWRSFQWTISLGEPQ